MKLIWRAWHYHDDHKLAKIIILLRINVTKIDNHNRKINLKMSYAHK